MLTPTPQIRQETGFVSEQDADGFPTVCSDTDDQGVTRLAIESLPQATARHTPAEPVVTFFGGTEETRGGVNGIDWSMGMTTEDNYNISTGDGTCMDGCGSQDEFFLLSHDVQNPDSDAIGSLFHSSFDTWTALEGTLQPEIDGMDPIW